MKLSFPVAFSNPALLLLGFSGWSCSGYLIIAPPIDHRLPALRGGGGIFPLSALALGCPGRLHHVDWMLIEPAFSSVFFKLESEPVNQSCLVDLTNLKLLSPIPTVGFPGGTGDKESACQCRRCRRLWSDSWVGKISWSRKWQLTPVFLPGKPHGQRSLAGKSP